MTAAQEFFRNLLKGGPESLSPEGMPYAWATIAERMNALTADPLDGTLTLLGEMLDHPERIPVAPGKECPHLFTPREALQLLALQALAGWRKEHPELVPRIDGLIQHFADTTESDLLEGTARAFLTHP